MLIRNPEHSRSKAKIRYWNIGDYLNREQKLNRLREAKGLEGQLPKMRILQPNEAGDWINQRTEGFKELIPLASSSKRERNYIFTLSTLGVCTERDAWAVNFDSQEVLRNIGQLVENYNSELERYRSTIDKPIDIKEWKKKTTHSSPGIEDYGKY